MDDEELSKFYDDIYRTTPGKWNETARDVFAYTVLSKYVDNPEKMLDYGCGNGHTLHFFSVWWRKTRYTGVDLSAMGLRLAQFNVPSGTFSKTLPENERWNVILLMGVAEHFMDPRVGLERFRDKLADDGIIYLEVPNTLYYSLDQNEGYRETTDGSGQVEWHWKRTTWEDAIHAAGLEIVKSYMGHQPAWEFVWVLRKDDHGNREDIRVLDVDRVSELSPSYAG